MTPAQFTQAVINDMQLPNDGSQLGYARTVWAFTCMGLQARGDFTPTWWHTSNPAWKTSTPWTAITPWWQIMPMVGNTIDRPQVEVGTIATIARLAGTQTWVTINKSKSGWWYVGDPAGTQVGSLVHTPGTIPGYPTDIFTMAGGTTTLHGGSGVFTHNHTLYNGIIHCVAARMVGPNAAQAHVALWSGMDYYPFNGASINQTDGFWPSVSTGRLKKITTSWQIFCTAPLDNPGHAGDDASYPSGNAGVFMSVAGLQANPVAEPSGLLPTTGPAQNQAPVVNAGADRSITLPNTVALAGTVTDDGLPIGSPVTYAWTKVSGPGVVTFSDSTILNPVATFGSSGTFVLRLTANDGSLSAADNITVNVAPASAPTNQTPAEFIAEVISDMQSTNAGVIIGQQFDRYAAVYMGMAARGDQTPVWWVPTGPYASWTKGPAAWTATSPEWWAFPLSGNTATNVSIEIGHMITIGRLAGTNTWAVVVDVGGGIATLNDSNGGYISDITPTAGTVPAYTSSIYAWTPGTGGGNRIHGFSGVSEINVQLYDAVIHCVAMRLVGPEADIAQFALWSSLYWYPDVDYVIGQNDNGPAFLPQSCSSRLKLITDDWSYTACAPINPPGRGASAGDFPLGDSSGVYANLATMVSNPPSQPVGLLPTDQAPNLAPVVSAGTDQTITLPSAATLAGTVTDDGLPGTGLTRVWAKVDGPGNVAFSDAAALNPVVNFSSAGVYVLSLTANDGALITTDTVTITVNAAPILPPPVNQAPVVSAGPDQTVVMEKQIGGVFTTTTTATYWGSPPPPLALVSLGALAGNMTLTKDTAATYWGSPPPPVALMSDGLLAGNTILSRTTTANYYVLSTAPQKLGVFNSSTFNSGMLGA